MAKKVEIYAQYDLDDNLFYMPTKIVFFAKDSQSEMKEILVTTGTFAKARNCQGSFKIKVKQIDNAFIECENREPGVEVDLQNYQIISENEASFKFFRDDNTNHFLTDLKQAVSEEKFGPSFKDFQEHCADKNSAKNVKIITARGQSPKTIYEGMLFLQSQGLIKYTPRLENIIPVSYKYLEPKEFRASASSPQEAKMRVLVSVLDEIEKRPHAVSSSFGFSDDDLKTFEFTRDFLVSEIKKGRWSKTEINLYFTGRAGKEKQRHILNKLTKVKA